jgi:hypothetical protein
MGGRQMTTVGATDDGDKRTTVAGMSDKHGRRQVSKGEHVRAWVSKDERGWACNHEREWGGPAGMNAASIIGRPGQPWASHLLYCLPSLSNSK